MTQPFDPRDEDLFVPTVAGSAAARRTTKDPWHTSSLYVPAFFGGPIAVTILAAMNARRLGARQEVPAIIAAGAVTLAALLAFFAIPDSPPPFRLPVIAAGLVTYGFQLWRLRSPDRLHRLRGGTFASLFGPGLVAVVGSALVTAGLAAALGVDL